MDRRRKIEIENNFINYFLERETENNYEYETLKNSKMNNIDDDLDNLKDFTEQMTETDNYQNSSIPNKIHLTETGIEITDTEKVTENDTELENENDKYQLDKYQLNYNNVNRVKENNDYVNTNVEVETETEVETNYHNNELPNTITEIEEKNEVYVNEVSNNSTENKKDEPLPTGEATYTETEIETEITTQKEMEKNNKISETEVEMETDIETDTDTDIESVTLKNIDNKNETLESKPKSEIETKMKTEMESEMATEKETEIEIDNLPNHEIVNINENLSTTTLENDNYTKLLDTPIHHEKTTNNMMDSDIQIEIEQKPLMSNLTNKKNVNNNDNTTIPIENQFEKSEFDIPSETDSIDSSNMKSFGGYIDSVFNSRLIDLPNELSKLYMEHIKSEEKKYEASTSTNITEPDRLSEGITEEMNENFSQQKVKTFKSIKDMVVIDVINDDENKRVNTFVTNPDTADVTLTTDLNFKKDRTLKRSNAFYSKLPDEEEEKKQKNPIRKLRPPKSLFNKKLNFKFNQDTYRNYMLRKLHSHKHNSIAFATIRNNRSWSNEQPQASTSSTSNRQEIHESDLHKKSKFAKKIINKYNLSSFIARQRYKAKLKLEYYKIMYQRHLKQPQKNFQDYMKEYEEEKYETNPYIQEIFNEKEDIEDEEEMTEKESSRETENDNFDEEDKENQNPQNKIKLINNLIIKHENRNHERYENQDIPLIEKKRQPKENYFSKLEKKREQVKENEKKMDFSYYRQSYDDERNSRNIYLSEDLTKESLKRPQQFNQNELNKMIFKEIQRRNQARENYNRESFSEKLHFYSRKKEYYHFKSENYLLESPQKQLEMELKDMDLQHKMKLQNQTLHPEKLIIDIKDTDDESNDDEIEEKEEEKKTLLNKTPNPIKKSVSFKMDMDDSDSDEDDEPRHEPLKNVNPLKLKSCLSKHHVNYDKKLFMKDQIEMKKEFGTNSKKGNGDNNPPNKEIIASSIVNEYTSEMKSYIGDDFGNYFTGYAYNNFYYFNGKNYTLRSMFNPKMFYREYFSSENAIRTNDQFFSRYTRLFKILNFYRSIITTIYGIYELHQNLIDDNIQRFGATPFIVIEFFFLLTDLLIAFIKAYPNKVWFLWNVADWDPIKNSWTVWSLVANHETVLEILPVMINVILKVYHCRLSQLMGSEEIGSVINDIFGDSIPPSIKLIDLNQVSLILFVFSLVCQLLLHALRIDAAILSRCNIFGLAAVVFIKVLLMIVDITTNLLILYEFLVTLGTEIFTFNKITFVLFSVLLFSFIVTLCTNVVINIPLHYFFLKMGIKIRIDGLFIEYAEQLREYQYKTHSLDTFNNNSTTLTERRLNEVFEEYQEYANDTSTTQLLRNEDDNDNDDYDEKDGFPDLNVYNFDPKFKTRNISNKNEENVTKKISKIIHTLDPNLNTDTENNHKNNENNITKKITNIVNTFFPLSPKPKQEKEMKKTVSDIDEEEMININVIGSNGSITETSMKTNLVNSPTGLGIDYKNNKNTKKIKPIDTSNLTGASTSKTTSNLLSSKSITNLKEESTKPKPLNKDLIESISSLSTSSSNDINCLQDNKEFYESIDDLNNCTSNTYKRPINNNVNTMNNAGISKGISNNEAVTILNDLGSTTSINKKPQQPQQYIYTKCSTEDFTKANLNIKEENINEGIYKFYAKTITDIEKKINQLYNIGFKHIFQVSLKKAFHPFLIILFIYNIYMLYALYLILNRIWDWNPITAVLENGATLQEAGLIPDNSFFDWNNESSGFKFHWLVWFNIVINYLSGAILPVMYWISIVLYNISSVRKRSFLHYLN